MATLKALRDKVQLPLLLVLVASCLIFLPAKSKWKIVEELVAQAVGAAFLIGMAVLWPVLPRRFKAFATDSRFSLFRVLILLICILGAVYLMMALFVEARAPKALIPVGVLLAFIGGFATARVLSAIAGWLTELIRGKKTPPEASLPGYFKAVRCAGCGANHQGGVINWADAEDGFVSFAVIGYFCANCAAYFCEKCKRTTLKWNWWSGFEHSTCTQCNGPFHIGDCLLESSPPT